MGLLDNRLLGAAQLTLAAGCLALGHLWPRTGEQILVVPLLPHSEARSMAIARGHGALLVQAGRLPGSFVIDGLTPGLTSAVAASGALLIRTGRSGCQGRRPAERAGNERG